MFIGCLFWFFFFKQKTAYEMRISDWSSDVCSSDLLDVHRAVGGPRLFTIGNDHPNAECAVERVVNEALESALNEAEAMLVARLGTVSLAELARRFDERCSSAF